MEYLLVSVTRLEVETGWFCGSGVGVSLFQGSNPLEEGGNLTQGWHISFVTRGGFWTHSSFVPPALSTLLQSITHVTPTSIWGIWQAQSVEHVTPDFWVESSSPTRTGVEFTLFLFF